MKDEIVLQKLSEDTTTQILNSHDEDDAGFTEDRFKVDRKKLEKMLQGMDGPEYAAEKFFENIMRDTNTIISWPLKLKIGAKSKKDPHIKIRGTPQNVKIAKSIIMEKFDIKRINISLKLDIPYDEHSFIIGKEGKGTRKISAETGAQIHFPDTNKNSTKKNNLASLRGTPEAVEAARLKLRQMTGITFSFVIPNAFKLSEEITRNLLGIQNQYEIKITTEIIQQGLLVGVRGLQARAALLVEGCEYIIKMLLCDISPVSTCLKILPDTQPYVRGYQDSNIKKIMRHTQTQIIFPEFRDVTKNGCGINFNSESASSIIINSTAVRNVYNGRQMLIDCLPLLLMFDVPAEKLLDVNKYDLPLEVKVKYNEKNNTKTIIVKCPECAIGQAYKTRRDILKQEEQQTNLEVNNWTTGLANLYLDNQEVKNTSFFKLDQFLFNNNNSNNNLTPEHGAFIDKVSRYGSAPSSTASTLSTPGQSPGRCSPIDEAFQRSALNNGNGLNTILEMDGQNDLSRTATSHNTLIPVDKRAPGCERAARMDYFEKKSQAVEAMYHHFEAPETRIPTDKWSGYGFSLSTPEGILKEQLNQIDAWSDNCSTNIFGQSSAFGLQIDFPKTIKNIHEILSFLCLEKYIDNFVSQEVDFETFLMLTEVDLINLGITNLGPRKKIMAAINDLKSNSFSPAPGAERKLKR